MSNAQRTALRSSLEAARLSVYSAKVQRCLDRQLATERAELEANLKSGSAMAIANRNAIADLLARGAR